MQASLGANACPIHNVPVPAQRKLLRRREEPGEARYLTFSCYHRLPLFQNDRIKDAFVNQLRLVKRNYAFWLLAWVVMPTHVHLLLVPDIPTTTVPGILAALKRRFATIVLARWRDLDAPILSRLHDKEGKPHFWQQGGGYDRNEAGGTELQEKIRYIHNNPVVAGLATRAEDWRWSSASAWQGLPYFGPPLDHVAFVGRKPPTRE